MKIWDELLTEFLDWFSKSDIAENLLKEKKRLVKPLEQNHKGILLETDKTKEVNINVIKKKNKKKTDH